MHLHRAMLLASPPSSLPSRKLAIRCHPVNTRSGSALFRKALPGFFHHGDNVLKFPVVVIR